MKFLGDVSRWLFWGPLRKVLSRLDIKYILLLEGVLSLPAYHLLPERRRTLSVELRKSFGREWPEDKITRAVRDSFRVSVGSHLRMLYLDKLNSANIDKYVSIEGAGQLKEASLKGQGAILLNPHFGPFMLIMPALGHRGYKVNQIALQGEPPWGERKGMDKKVYDLKFKATEGNMPVKFINAALGAFTLRQAFLALKKAEIVLYPSTGRGGAAFHKVDFMRRKMLLSLTPFSLALKTRAALIPAFLVCEGVETKLRLEKGIVIEDGSTAEKLAEDYAKVLDAYIEKYPSHFIAYLYEVHKKTMLGEAPFFVE